MSCCLSLIQTPPLWHPSILGRRAAQHAVHLSVPCRRVDEAMSCSGGTDEDVRRREPRRLHAEPGPVWSAGEDDLLLTSSNADVRFPSYSHHRRLIAHAQSRPVLQRQKESIPIAPGRPVVSGLVSNLTHLQQPSEPPPFPEGAVRRLYQSPACSRALPAMSSSKASVSVQPDQSEGLTKTSQEGRCRVTDGSQF